MTDWTHVQGKGSQSPAGGTLTITLTSAITNGDIVVGGVLLSTGFTLSSITDDKGNSYTIFDSHDDGSLYTAAYISDTFITNGPITFTFTASATPGNFWGTVDEFGPPTGATSISTDGFSTTASSPGTTFTSFATSLADDLIYAVAFTSSGATHGSDLNAGSGDGTQVCSEWGIAASPGTVTMDLATQPGNLWGPAFAVNSGGAAPPVTPSPILGMAACEW